MLAMLTQSECAELLRLSERTLERLRVSGLGPNFVRVGRFPGLRAAIKAAPYKHPKLSATAIGHFDGQTFAQALERCIERSKSPPPLLNGPVEELPASE